MSTEEVSYDGILDNGDSTMSSDHISFTEAGIPVALFTNSTGKGASSEPYANTEKDNFEHISRERLERSIYLVGEAVYRMAHTS